MRNIKTTAEVEIVEGYDAKEKEIKNAKIIVTSVALNGNQVELQIADCKLRVVADDLHAALRKCVNR